MDLEKLTETKLNISQNPPEPTSGIAADNTARVDSNGATGGGLLSQVIKDKKKKKKKLTAKEKAQVYWLHIFKD